MNSFFIAPAVFPCYQPVAEQGQRNRLIGGAGFATVAAATGILPESMPLHFGKIFAAIALLTVGAFIAWLLFTTLFATEQAEQKIDKTGAAELSVPVAA
jgi:hypothetical protein